MHRMGTDVMGGSDVIRLVLVWCDRFEDLFCVGQAAME